MLRHHLYTTHAEQNSHLPTSLGCTTDQWRAASNHRHHRAPSPCYYCCYYPDPHPLPKKPGHNRLKPFPAPCAVAQQAMVAPEWSAETDASVSSWGWAPRLLVGSARPSRRSPRTSISQKNQTQDRSSCSYRQRGTAPECEAGPRHLLPPNDGKHPLPRKPAAAAAAVTVPSASTAFRDRS